MIIAERIYRGATAGEIGIPVAEYASRSEVLGRFLDQWAGSADFENEYLAWLSAQTDGERGNSAVMTPPLSSSTVRVVQHRPCNSCGGGRIR
jgi:hypothetical protein